MMRVSRHLSARRTADRRRASALLVALIWFLAGQRDRHGTLFESYFSESVQGLEVGAAGQVSRRDDRPRDGHWSGQCGIRQAASQSMSDARPIAWCLCGSWSTPRRSARCPTRRRPWDWACGSGWHRRASPGSATSSSTSSIPRIIRRWMCRGSRRRQYIPSMPSTFLQVQDAAQQVLAKLNRRGHRQAGQPAEYSADRCPGRSRKWRCAHDAGECGDDAARPSMRRCRPRTCRPERRHQAHVVRRCMTRCRESNCRTLLDNAGLAADRLATAAAKLPALIASVQATAQRAGSGTADLEQGLIPLLRDMQATAQNLREMSESLRRYPAQVFGPPPPRSPAAGTMRRRWCWPVLAAARRLFVAAAARRMCSGATGRSTCSDRRSTRPKPRGRVLLVRSVRAAPGTGGARAAVAAARRQRAC